MRIALHSDLHEEFYPVGEAPLPEQSEVDLVLLAGDNNTGAGLPDMLRRYHNHFNVPVLCVLGNHEYYDAEMVTTEKEIIAALSGENDIHFLQKSVFEIDNVRVLGCTLWSDFLIDGQEGKQDAIQTCRSRVMDYRLIQYRDKQFTPEDSMDLMNDHLTWLRGELDQDFSGKTVVMTHHCPSIYFV
ncbi:MAG: metallophosphoesterase, partial [Pseudomonadales bacterium]|nr:metallophosphoesterase [Pseudomonadales bacterium]